MDDQFATDFILIGVCVHILFITIGVCIERIFTRQIRKVNKKKNNLQKKMDTISMSIFTHHL